MKRLFILLLSLAVCACDKPELEENPGNNDPDVPGTSEEDIFLQFCIREFDTDGDGEISQYEADQVRSIDCSGMEIVKLTGIGKFSNLEMLDCSNNRLTTLDLSQNRHLVELICMRNSLSTLDVGVCPFLRTLDCSYNSLTALDFSKNANIVTVTCKRNALASLLLTDCAELVSLDCSYNLLTTLDMNYNKKQIKFR